MGYCSKGIGNSNTDRIERFVIGSISSSLKVPLSNIRYRLQLLAEGIHALNRNRGDESTHASSMRLRGIGWSYAPTESTSSHPRRMIMILVTDVMESLDTEPVADTIHSLST